MAYFNEAVDHDGWGLRLAETRSLDGFRTYGAQVGLSELGKAWSHFLFTRDARGLAFTTKRLKQLSEKSFDWGLGNGLKIRGALYDDPRKEISSRERSHWLNGFTESYKEVLEENVSEIIPREIEDKLPLFCKLVAAIQNDAEAGYDSSDFGVHLGARKSEEPRKIHPKREAIIKKAKAEGLHDANVNWHWQVHGETNIRRPQFISPPFNWKLSPEEEELYEKVFEKAFMEHVRKQIAKTVPAKAWKNAFLICSLYDEMELQRHEGRSSTKDYGWSYLKYLRENEHRRTEERMKLETEAREKRWRRIQSPAVAGASLGHPSLGAFISRAVQMTPGARGLFEETGDNPERFLDRHFNEDFGDLPKEDVPLNQQSARTGGMVMSIYNASNGEQLYVVTDNGHEVTTILLPTEW